MCSFAGIGVDDTLRVYVVNSYVAGGMNDLVIVEEDAHVGDLSFIIIKKSKIAANCFLQKTDSLPLCCLL